MKKTELNELCSQYKSEINRRLFNKAASYEVGYSFGRNVSNTIYIYDRHNKNILQNIGTYSTAQEVLTNLKTLSTLLLAEKTIYN